MRARPSVQLLSAALLLAAGGLLWLAVGSDAPDGRGGEGAVAPTPDPRAAPRPAEAAPPPAPSAEPPAPAEPEALSPVPHEVVVRGESAPDSAHRVLVLAVDPHLPTESLERLLRDVRERYRDASVLDVRVYDSKELAEPDRARYRRTGGTLRGRHRVAEMRRNDRLELDVMRIRGVEVEL